MATIFKISTDTINNSAVTAVTSTTQGFLKPRMTSTERGGIDGPVEGLEVYNTTLHAPEYLDDNEVWIRVGNVVGPVTATDNAIAKYDLNGKLIQNSGVTIDDSNNVSVPGNITVSGNIEVTGAIKSHDFTQVFLLMGA